MFILNLFVLYLHNAMWFVAAGIEAVAPDTEKYTKPKGKERPTEAPLPFWVLLFFSIGTTSEKPVAAQEKILVLDFIN